MTKLQLSYPAKPFVQTQAWGVANPSYIQFGFDRHNGSDFMMGVDKRTYAPVRFQVEDAGFNDGAGNFVRGITTEKLEVEGVEAYVGLMFMHHEKLLCKTGDILEEGDVMGIADNTGFSTGPHTHMSVYRLKRQKNISANRLDTDPHTNYTFDPQPYWNGKYAQDLSKENNSIPPNTTVTFATALKLLRKSLTGISLEQAEAVLRGKYKI